MMKPLRHVLAPGVLAVACASLVLASSNVRLRLGTVVPEGSIWHQALQQLDAGWRKASDGRVQTVIYGGSTQGDEDNILRRMRAGQLQMGAFTSVGLTRIDRAFNLFSIPFFFESHEELVHVIDRLTPELTQVLERNNLVLLNWGHAGWVQVFSKRPVTNLDSLRRVRLFTSSGDDDMRQWYVRNNFRPEALAVHDLYVSLQSNRVEAVPFPPMAALAFQWYRATPHMLEISLAPVIGATLISRSAWENITPADREKLLEVAEQVEERLEREVPQKEREAIAEMQKRGLKITRLSETDNPAEWREAAEMFVRTMPARMMPPDDLLERARRARDSFRAQRTAGGVR